MNTQEKVTESFEPFNGIRVKKITDESGKAKFYVNDIEVDYFEFDVTQKEVKITIIAKEDLTKYLAKGLLTVEYKNEKL